MAKNIFNFFFRKKETSEKIKEAASRAQNMLNDVIGQSRYRSIDSSTVEKLCHLSDQMTHQFTGEDETIKEIYYRIIRYLKDLKVDIQNGYRNVVGIRLDHFAAEVNKLGTYGTSETPFATSKAARRNKQIDRELEEFDKNHKSFVLSEDDIDIGALYTDDELLQIAIYREQDKLDMLNKKLEELENQSWEADGSLAIASDIQHTNDSIKKEEDIIKALDEVRKTNAAAGYMKSMPKVKQQAMASAGISVEELESIYQDFKKFKAKDNADKMTVTDIRDDIYGTSQKNGTGVASFQTAEAAVQNIQNSNSQPKKKMSEFSQEELKSYYVQAKKQKAAFEKADETYRRLIAEKQGEWQTVANRLRTLLLKRKSLIENGENVSEQDCSGYESEIEKVKSKFYNLQKALDQLTRARNENNARLSIVDRMLQTLEIQRTQGKIAAMLGNQAMDIGSIAMYLKQFDEEGNKEMMQVRDALAITDSVDIEKSVSDYGVDESIGQNLADPDKYADLEKRLGLR